MYNRLITATALTFSLALFASNGQHLADWSNAPLIQPSQPSRSIAETVSRSSIFHKSLQPHREPCSKVVRLKKWNILEPNSIHELSSSAILVNGRSVCF
jgi:hypothetical protein